MPENGIITAIESKDVLNEWDNVAPLLQRVIDRMEPGLSSEDVLTNLQWTNHQLWKIDDWKAMAITQISILPEHKLLNLTYLAGDGIEGWLGPLVDVLKSYAKDHECKYMEFYGRDGWRKIAKTFGFDKAYTVMRLDINGKE